MNLLKSTIKNVSWILAERSMQCRQERRTGIKFPAVFDEKNTIFIHIPKTGGTSIALSLFGINIAHESWSYWSFINPRKAKRYWSFAVVRDPIERFLSAFDYLSSGGMNERDRRFANNEIPLSGDLNGFVRGMMNSDINDRLLAYDHFRPQWTFVCDSERRVRVKYLLKFENLDEDYELVKKQLGVHNSLPKLNATSGLRTKRTALTEESVEILKLIYKRDYTLMEIAETYKCLESLIS